MADWPYSTAQWQRVRRMVLHSQPLCAACAELGYSTPSDVVDHIQPVRDRPDLAFTLDNLRGLCKLCHDSAKKREEMRGHEIGSKRDGSPMDAKHFGNDGGGRSKS